MRHLFIALLFMASCGFPTAKHEATFNSTDGWSVARARAVANLTRRGYRIADEPLDTVQTEWRYIRIHPGEMRETWFGLRIRITMDREGRILGECMQKRYGAVKATQGYKEPPWTPCTDPDLMGMVTNAVDDLARELSQ